MPCRAGLGTVSAAEAVALSAADVLYRLGGGRIDIDLQRVAFLSHATGVPRPTCAAWCFRHWIEAANQGLEPAWWRHEAYACALAIAKSVPKKQQRNRAAGRSVGRLADFVSNDEKSPGRGGPGRTVISNAHSG